MGFVGLIEFMGLLRASLGCGLFCLCYLLEGSCKCSSSVRQSLGLGLLFAALWFSKSFGMFCGFRALACHCCAFDGFNVFQVCDS